VRAIAAGLQFPPSSPRQLAAARGAHRRPVRLLRLPRPLSVHS